MLKCAKQLELPVHDTPTRKHGSERPHASGPTQQGPNRSVAQPEDRALRRIAAARIRAAALHREERAKLTPEQIADRMTSLADARIALCVAQGNALDDIDSASGYSLSRESYERVRQSWRNQAKQPGWSEYLRPDLEKAIAYWSERRPEFTEGDDWLSDLIQ
ncbi:hypothetical protein ACH492_22050 [Streptomyces sp. NPDC019443]|uniref:hypothetical protein n=1 Tax=Streptomyces sp. NPDC019443 TaxID=3365061 RepID=UPI00379BFAD1